MARSSKTINYNTMPTRGSGYGGPKGRGSSLGRSKSKSQPTINKSLSDSSDRLNNADSVSPNTSTVSSTIKEHALNFIYVADLCILFYAIYLYRTRPTVYQNSQHCGHIFMGCCQVIGSILTSQLVARTKTLSLRYLKNSIGFGSDAQQNMNSRNKSQSQNLLNLNRSGPGSAIYNTNSQSNTKQSLNSKVGPPTSSTTQGQSDKHFQSESRSTLKLVLLIRAILVVIAIFLMAFTDDSLIIGGLVLCSNLGCALLSISLMRDHRYVSAKGKLLRSSRQARRAYLIRKYGGVGSGVDSILGEAQENKGLINDQQTTVDTVTQNGNKSLSLLRHIEDIDHGIKMYESDQNLSSDDYEIRSKNTLSQKDSDYNESSTDMESEPEFQNQNQKLTQLTQGLQYSQSESSLSSSDTENEMISDLSIADSESDVNSISSNTLSDYPGHYTSTEKVLNLSKRNRNSINNNKSNSQSLRTSRSNRSSQVTFGNIDNDHISNQRPRSLSDRFSQSFISSRLTDNTIGSTPGLDSDTESEHHIMDFDNPNSRSDSVKIDIKPDYQIHQQNLNGRRNSNQSYQKSGNQTQGPANSSQQNPQQTNRNLAEFLERTFESSEEESQLSDDDNDSDSLNSSDSEDKNNFYNGNSKIHHIPQQPNSISKNSKIHIPDVFKQSTLLPGQKEGQIIDRYYYPPTHRGPASDAPMIVTSENGTGINMNKLKSSSQSDSRRVLFRG